MVTNDNRNMLIMEEYYLARIETLKKRIETLETELKQAKKLKKGTR
jgi:hypothetical protein